jgi:WD40 repeat protein
MEIPGRNEFYFTGGTLRLDIPSYVHRKADDDLYEALLGGKFCYVLTSRQMGKSSLMVRTTIRLRNETAAKVAILDLQAIGQTVSVEQWYFGLLTKLGDQLKLKTELDQSWAIAGKDGVQLGPLQRFMTAIRAVVLKKIAGPVVIFIDEIDYVRSLGFPTDELFAGIRECYTSRYEDTDLLRLSFCLLGVTTPADLIKNIYTTPFNIGERIELNDFSAEEAASLATGLGRDQETNRLLLSRIFYWTNGHPYLTQKFCLAVADDAAIQNDANIDALCERLFLSVKAQQQDDNLVFARDRILKVQDNGEKDALLDLYEKAYLRKSAKAEERNPLVATLKLSGITRVEGGQLRVRNNIYKRIFNRQWIIDNRSSVEMIRRKEAYRSGVVKTAAAATVVLAVLVALLFNMLKAKSDAVEARRVALLAVDSLQRNNKELNATKKNLLDAFVHLDTAIGVQKRLKEQAQATTDSLRIVLEENQQARNKALSTSETFRAEDAIELRDQLAVLQALHKAWKLDSANAEIPRLFYRYIPYRSLPGILHGGPVNSAAFSPDGRLVLSASDDSTVNIVSTDGRDILNLPHFAAWVRSAVFSPDGTKIATIDDRTCRLWNAKGVFIDQFIHAKKINTVSFSPDSKMVLTASDDMTAALWDLTTRKLVSLEGHKDRVTQAVFGPVGDRILTGSADGTVRLWDLRGTCLNIFKAHRSPINCVGFNRDETRIITASGDGFSIDSDNRAIVWTIGGDTVFTLHDHSEPVLFARFSPDGSFIATGGEDNQVFLYDINGKSVKSIRPFSSKVTVLCFSRDSRQLLAGSDDKTIKLIPTGRSSGAGVPLSTDAEVGSAVFSSTGDTILTGTKDGRVRLWTSGGKEIYFLTRHYDYINTAFFSPRTNTVVTSSDDQSAILWDLDERSRPIALEHGDVVRYANFSPDGKYVLTTSGRKDRSARVFTAAGDLKAVLSGYEGRVNYGCFSRNDSLLLTASADGTVKQWIWNRAFPICKYTYRHPKEVISAVYIGEDKIVTACADNKIRFWSTAGGKEEETDSLSGFDLLGTVVWNRKTGRILVCSGTRAFLCESKGKIIGTFLHKGTVKSAEFSPDGSKIITASADNVVKIWDAASDKFPLFSLTGVFAAFSADASLVVTVSEDYTIKVWPIDPAQVLGSDRQ